MILDIILVDWQTEQRWSPMLASKKLSRALIVRSAIDCQHMRWQQVPVVKTNDRFEDGLHLAR